MIEVVFLLNVQVTKGLEFERARLSADLENLQRESAHLALRATKAEILSREAEARCEQAERDLDNATEAIQGAFWNLDSFSCR